MAREPLRVLFLCTANAARSQMAEALLRHVSKNRAEAFSAGNLPAAEIHPAAKTVLEQKFGIDTSGLYPKLIDSLPIHWSFEDSSP